MAVQDIPNPIVHKVTLPGNERVKAKTKIEEIMAERETRAAQRYSIAELEKMALEAENEAARLRGEPPKYKYHTGGEELNEEERKKREEQRQQLMDSAKALIDSGMEPKQVGQMLLGLPFTGQPGSPVVAQGLVLDDVLKIVNLVTEKKEMSEIRSIIATLDKKIDDLAKRGNRHGENTNPPAPQDVIRQYTDAIVALNAAMDELRPKSPPLSEKGEPLEVVRERNRHDEKMEEIRDERAYKKALVEIAGDIPERVGMGIAGQIGEGNDRGHADGNLEILQCEECHEKIYITPDTGNQVTCPKCQSVYTRHGKEAPDEVR